MSVTLTERAAERVRKVLARTPGSVALRFSVTESGCSGYAYSLDVENNIAESDQIFSSFGVDVVVNASNLNLISGTEIDYISEGLNQTFRFSNPQATGECGCGESFAVSN